MRMSLIFHTTTHTRTQTKLLYSLKRVGIPNWFPREQGTLRWFPRELRHLWWFPRELVGELVGELVASRH